MALRQRLESIALATGQLTTRQVKLAAGMIAEIDRLDRRKTALKAARGALDPGSELSTWQVALLLESALKRFDAVSRRRIESGYRAPNALEVHLMTLTDNGPTCARKLWTELRELL